MRSFIGETVDVCVVGSGAGGGPLAWALARAGASVVVLEKGPWYKPTDFVRDEIGTCRRDYWRPTAAEEPRLHYYPGQRQPQKAVDSWIACCVGGGTAHMSGFVYRLHPEDFRMKSRYGSIAGANLADWPISYDDLEPYYQKAEEVMGASGENEGNPFEPKRSGRYPHPPLQYNPLAALVDQGARKLGLHPFHTPRLIISEAREGRAACLYHIVCGSYGCEVSAKSSTLAACIPGAVDSDRCEVRPRSMAFEIASQGDQVTGVRYYDETGAAQEQKARVVVVSATAIESARLLLNSRLGNGSGLLGRNLTFSTAAKGWGEFLRSSLPPEMAADHPVHFVQRSVQDTYFLKERAGAYDKGGTLNYLLPHANPIAAAERLSSRSRPRLWGEALASELHRHYHEVREIEFEVFGEFLPNPETYVSVSSEVRDRWGIPVAEVHLRIHDEDRKNSKLVAEKGVEILAAGGAERTGIETSGTTTWVLQHGTCRFGKDPATSVLDPNCRVHETKNLYVVDGSFMPTSGGVSSTLTIVANSLRVADHLLERFQQKSVP